MHFLHLCIRVSQVSKVPDSDLGWEDMYREGEGDSWFDWVRGCCVFSHFNLDLPTRIHPTDRPDDCSPNHRIYPQRDLLLHPH